MREITFRLTTAEYEQLDRLLRAMREHGHAYSDQHLWRSIFLCGIGAIQRIQRTLEDGGDLDSYLRQSPDERKN